MDKIDQENKNNINNIGFIPANEYESRLKMKTEFELRNRIVYNYQKIQNSIKKIEEENKNIVLNNNWKNIKSLLNIPQL